MAREVTLVGGPCDGKRITVEGSAPVRMPVAHPPKRMVTEDDEFDPDTLDFVDPDLRSSFTHHVYDVRTGRYLGVQ
jgi:hypothetical protein